MQAGIFILGWEWLRAATSCFSECFPPVLPRDLAPYKSFLAPGPVVPSLLPVAVSDPQRFGWGLRASRGKHLRWVYQQTSESRAQRPDLTFPPLPSRLAFLSAVLLSPSPVSVLCMLYEALALCGLPDRNSADGVPSCHVTHGMLLQSVFYPIPSACTRVLSSHQPSRQQEPFGKSRSFLCGLLPTITFFVEEKIPR